MKIHHQIALLFAGAILVGLAARMFIPADHPETVSERFDRDRDRTPKSYTAASISKSTILLLLAVGVIGALGVNRKKKGAESDRADHSGGQAGQRPEANGDRKKDQP